MRTVAETVSPNWMRHFFPSYRVPRVSFAETSLHVEVPPRVGCIETTLSQGVLALENPDRQRVERFLELLTQLDGRSGLLQRVEVRVTDRVGRRALELALERHAVHGLRAEPVAVVPTTPAAPATVEGLGLHEVGIGVGVSDFHVYLSRAGSRQALVDRLLAVMDGCLEREMRPRIDLIDVTRADLEGFLFPLVETCLEHLARQGGGRLRLRLCDTLGLGLPWSEVPVPRSVPRLIHTIRHALGLQPEQLEFLGANALGLALANSLAAMGAGCSGLACSIGGVGERGGITPTELALLHLSGLSGEDCDLGAVAHLLSLLEPLGLDPGAQHPLWGEEALTTSELPTSLPVAEASELFAPFDTGRLLGRTPRIEVRPHSGPRGIAHLIRAHTPGIELAHDDERVREIHRWVREHSLRHVSWELIEVKVRQVLPELFQQAGEDGGEGEDGREAQE